MSGFYLVARAEYKLQYNILLHFGMLAYWNAGKTV